MNRRGDPYEFNWFVKNFSMCPVRLDESLSSPVFTVDQMFESKWSLELRPKGHDASARACLCFLHCVSLGGFDMVRATYSIRVIPNQAEGMLTEEFMPDLRSTFPAVVPESELRGANRTRFLPNDTLTVQCLIHDLWWGDLNHPGVEDRLLGRVEEFLPRDTVFFPLKLTVETTIEVHRKSVAWPVPNLDHLPENNFTARLPKAGEDLPSFAVQFGNDRRRSGGDLRVGLRIFHWSRLAKVFAKCFLTVLKSGSNRIANVREAEFLFEQNGLQEVEFPFGLRTGDMEETVRQGRENLYMRVDVAFAVEGAARHQERTFSTIWYLPVMRSPPAPQDPATAVADRDVVLCCRGRHFQVNRRVVSARSRVFADMFQRERAAAGGVVHVGQVDPNTLDRMMLVFHSGNLPEPLELGDMARLYMAARTYVAPELLHWCAAGILARMGTENVCQVLRVADALEDEYMFRVACELVECRPHHVLCTPQWVELMGRDPSLAARVMHRILTTRFEV